MTVESECETVFTGSPEAADRRRLTALGFVSPINQPTSRTETTPDNDRVMFLRCVEHGTGPIGAYAARLTDSVLPVDEPHCFQLGIPAGSTLGHAAKTVLARIAAGTLAMP